MQDSRNNGEAHEISSSEGNNLWKRLTTPPRFDNLDADLRFESHEVIVRNWNFRSILTHKYDAKLRLTNSESAYMISIWANLQRMCAVQQFSTFPNPPEELFSIRLLK